ncbi:MAG: hypothetical protein HYZ79_02890 [Candidatus Melainabacteria bacterium]|nr:hypothetical protein [Candidatus Melainabacteria bacterium]
MQKFCLMLAVLSFTLMSYIPLSAHAGHVKIDQFDESGVAICKFKGGAVKIPRKVKLLENEIIVDEIDEELEIDLVGDLEKGDQELFFEIGVDVEGVDIDAKVIKTTTDEAELFIEVFDGENEFGIVALNQDESMATLESNVVVKTTEIEENEDGDFVSGKLTVTYPRTVKLPIDEFDELLDLIDSEEPFELTLENAEENGPMKVTCLLKDVPSFGDDEDFDDEDFDDEDF